MSVENKIVIKGTKGTVLEGVTNHQDAEFSKKSLESMLSSLNEYNHSDIDVFEDVMNMINMNFDEIKRMLTVKHIMTIRYVFALMMFREDLPFEFNAAETLYQKDERVESVEIFPEG